MRNTLLYLLGCMIAKIGSYDNPRDSNSHPSKTITIEDGFRCPLSIDESNWINEYNNDDYIDNTYSVKQKGDNVTVSRYWKWNVDLKLKCCKGKFTKS